MTSSALIHPRWRGRSLFSAGMLALVVVACGGGSDGIQGPAAGAEFDGCELITTAEVEAILGGRVARSVPSGTTPAAAVCIWGVADAAGSGQLQLSVFRGRQFFGEEHVADDPTYEEVPGVGDEAFLVRSSGLQLHVLVDDFSAVVSVSGLKSTSSDDTEVELHVVELGGRIASRLASATKGG